MTARLLNFKWDLSKPITMHLVTDLCPWPDEIEIQLMHQCDYLNYITDGKLPLFYGGRVDAKPEEIKDHNLYCKFIPTADTNSMAWAWPRLKTASPTMQIIGGVNYYRLDRIPHYSDFCGISVHELLHLLGFAHVQADSVMSLPYIPAERQALLLSYDFDTLDQIIGRPCKRIPAVNDYGDLEPTRALIQIPSIKVSWLEHKRVTLHVDLSDGIKMWCTDRDVGPAGRRDKTSYIKDDKLHMPLRYRGVSYNVSADIVQNGDRTDFVDIDLRQERAA